MSKTACIIGATGLVGSKLVNLLISDDEFEKVKMFVRRPAEIDHAKVEEFVIDFDNQEEWQKNLTGDVLFSCLGTTLKVAGSKNEQFKIDYTYQYNFAEAACKNNIPAYVLISSAGANPESQIFYSQMKGQLDQVVLGLDFQIIRILKPSVLDGHRKERRRAEQFAIKALQKLIPVLPFLRKYAPIKGYRVAQAMINSLKDYPDLKSRVYVLDEVLELSSKF